MATIYRQGDVLLIKTTRRARGEEQGPEGGRLILARGEATGHHHSVDPGTCSLYADEQRPVSEADAATMIARLGGGLIPDRTLVVRRETALMHQEHDPITVPRGTYVVRIQREYRPGALRNVAD